MKKISEYKEEVVKVVKESLDLDDAISNLIKLDYEVSKDELEVFLKGEQHDIKLSDDDLARVSGGTDWYEKKYYLDKNAVQFLFKKGDTVEVASGFGFGTTVKCTIKEVGYGYFDLANGGQAYFDIYYCENLEYTWYFYDGWKSRDLIEKR